MIRLAGIVKEKSERAEDMRLLKQVKCFRDRIIPSTAERIASDDPFC